MDHISIKVNTFTATNEREDTGTREPTLDEFKPDTISQEFKTFVKQNEDFEIIKLNVFSSKYYNKNKI